MLSWDRSDILSGGSGRWPELSIFFSFNPKIEKELLSRSLDRIQTSIAWQKHAFLSTT